MIIELCDSENKLCKEPPWLESLCELWQIPGLVCKIGIRIMPVVAARIRQFMQNARTSAWQKVRDQEIPAIVYSLGVSWTLWR